MTNGASAAAAWFDQSALQTPDNILITKPCSKLRKCVRLYYKLTLHFYNIISSNSETLPLILPLTEDSDVILQLCLLLFLPNYIPLKRLNTF